MVRVVNNAFGYIVHPKNRLSEEIRRIVLTNNDQISVSIITLGATIQKLIMPDVKCVKDDIVLGFDKPVDYQINENMYMGSLIGRVCNRIQDGSFELNGREYKLTRNFRNQHHDNGGCIGLSRLPWRVQQMHTNGVTLAICSGDGDEGYPGLLSASAYFALSDDNCLKIRVEAETTQATPINMTNHVFFNLAGHQTGREALCEHSIMISAKEAVDISRDGIPSGFFDYLPTTDHDLRNLSNLGDRLTKLALKSNGYNRHFIFKPHEESIPTQALVVHPVSGRWMRVNSNQPNLHFHTANELPDCDEPPLLGKEGSRYVKRGAFVLAPQQFPDAVNRHEFPSIILQPDGKYVYEVIYQFGWTRRKSLCPCPPDPEAVDTEEPTNPPPKEEEPEPKKTLRDHIFPLIKSKTEQLLSKEPQNIDINCSAKEEFDLSMEPKSAQAAVPDKEPEQNCFCEEKEENCAQEELDNKENSDDNSNLPCEKKKPTALSKWNPFKRIK